jgi:chorismate mutase / prephenate dehydrogenase
LDDQIERLRDRIAELDWDILEKVAERTGVAREIGRQKLSRGLPLRDLEVEKEVIERYRSLATGLNLQPDDAEALATTVIRQAVEAQAERTAAVPQRILIVGGAGKMGIWLHRYLTTRGHEVRVLDPKAEGDLSTAHNLMEGLEWSDVTIISTPISMMPDVMREVIDLRPKGLVFDIASIKTPIIPLIKEGVEKGLHICSVHPMFGPEVRSLYDRNLIVCDCGFEPAVEEAWKLFDGSGGLLVRMEVESHDELMSFVLDLSHAVSLAFFGALGQSGFPYETLEKVASTTFRKQMETSRDVAFENPRLYFDIQHQNPYAKRALSLLTKSVQEIGEATASGDEEAFLRIMEGGRRYFGGNK